MFAMAEIRLRGTSHAFYCQARALCTVHSVRGPLKLRNVAVEFPLFREILVLLWRHFRRILTTRHAARSELSASDLVLCEPFLLGIIARHLSPPHCLSALRQGMDDHWPGNRCSWSSEQRPANSVKTTRGLIRNV